MTRDNAAVGDIALVVRVRQQAVHRGHRERLGRALRGGQADQAAGGEFVVELADRPVPRGVGLERPLDQRGAFEVELHGADLAAGVRPTQPVSANLERTRSIYKTRTHKSIPWRSPLDHRPVTGPSMEMGAGSGWFT